MDRYFAIITELGEPVQCTHPISIEHAREEFLTYLEDRHLGPDELVLDNSDEFHFSNEADDTGFHVLPAGPPR